MAGGPLIRAANQHHKRQPPSKVMVGEKSPDQDGKYLLITAPLLCTFLGGCRSDWQQNEGPTTYVFRSSIPRFILPLWAPFLCFPSSSHSEDFAAMSKKSLHSLAVLAAAMSVTGLQPRQTDDSTSSSGKHHRFGQPNCLLNPILLH